MHAEEKRPDMAFMRLLFVEPAQEKVAYAWAERLADLFGAQALKLRPETKLAELLRWAVLAEVDAMDFTMVFEPELHLDLARFLNEADTITFREMVEYYTRPFSTL
jgi:hypothetical protein